MGKLDWMVNVNLFDNETGSFWNGPGMDPASIKTEVFMLPACVSVEKEGSITNSGRWMQWRYQGPKPLGNSLPDGDIILAGREDQSGIQGWGRFSRTDPQPEMGLRNRWRVRSSQGGQGDQRLFCQGCHHQRQNLQKGTLVPSFAFLQADGSTSSGNWLYCNSYTEKGNMAARRGQKDAANNIGLFPNSPGAGR
jgi:formate dehydrogenase major subunit